MELSTEGKKNYYEEVALALTREGFTVGPIADDRLEVQYDGRTLCEASGIGGITYRNENLDTEQRLEAKEKAYSIVHTTAEYMKLMEQAPPLKASGLDDTYKILADFNGVVLAGHKNKYGVQFVTWDWDYDRKGVSHGHYAAHHYEDAKRDFAIRSRLIPRSALFSVEQLTEIFRCCADTLDADLDLSYEQAKCIRDIQEQIEIGNPEVMEQLKQQEQHTAHQQEQTM